MIKKIISGREENYSIFLHCLCGKEIIQIYYYKEDRILSRIIGMQFYGQIKNPKYLIYNNFQFTDPSFIEFVDKLEEFINNDYNKDQKILMSHAKEDILTLKKDADGFFIIGRSKNLEEAREDSFIWDIDFRLPEAQEFLDELKKLKSIILQDRLDIIEGKSLNKFGIDHDTPV